MIHEIEKEITAKEKEKYTKT